jgi:hypothetical protein
MIDEALSYLKDILDQQLRNQFDIAGNMVVLNNLVDSSGGLPLKNQNKLVLTLINLEHETSKPFMVLVPHPIRKIISSGR